MFSIKQTAASLQISTQAIYKQKNELIEKGYMAKNDQGNWEITDAGFNYLQDKKITYMQQHNNQSIQPVTNQQKQDEPKKENESAENVDVMANDKVVNLLINQYKEQLQTVTSQLNEMTKQRDYFKAKFEEKDSICNQYMNSHLLPLKKNETETKENKSKNFFQKLFNK